MPEELRFSPERHGGVSATVRASGLSARGYLAILVTRAGARVELRGPTPLAVGDVGTLSWERAVELPPDEGDRPPAEPKSDRPVPDP